MLKVGLTGGIGSGKSTVARIFSLLGVPVYDADAVSKELYHTDAALKASMIETFGPDIYSEGGLDRARLAALVFGDEAALARLNALVHPPTIRHAERWMQAQMGPYLIKEAALLFESGSVAAMDYVIGVSAPEALRIRRVMQREGFTEAQVLQRMARQWDEEEKLGRCHFILRNDERELLLPQVIGLHQHLLSLQ